MKTIIALSILLCAIAYPTYSEPPQNSVETDIAVIKTEIKNLKESMDKGFANMQTQLDSEIKNLKESMDTGFANVQKNFDRIYTILIYFITVPMATLTIVVAIWGILTNRRSRKEDMLQNQIETLTQEIETLKKQRIVS